MSCQLALATFRSSVGCNKLETKSTGIKEAGRIIVRKSNWSKSSKIVEIHQYFDRSLCTDVLAYTDTSCHLCMRAGTKYFTVRECGYGNAFGRVCLSVCVCAWTVRALTFESLDLESSFLVCRYTFKIFRPSSYIKVIGSRSRWQPQNGYRPKSISRPKRPRGFWGRGTTRSLLAKEPGGSL